MNPKPFNRTVKHDPLFCPQCEKVLNYSHTDVADAVPSAGDFTVCFGCETLLEFCGEPLSLRALTATDFAQLPEDTMQDLYSCLQEVRRLNREVPSRN